MCMCERERVERTRWYQTIRAGRYTNTWSKGNRPKMCLCLSNIKLISINSRSYTAMYNKCTLWRMKKWKQKKEEEEEEEGLFGSRLVLVCERIQLDWREVWFSLSFVVSFCVVFRFGSVGCKKQSTRIEPL